MTDSVMPDKHLLVVMTKAVPGRATDYEGWLASHHFPHVLRMDGFAAIQGFRAAPPQPDMAPLYPYLGIYEVPADRLADAQASLAFQRAERAYALERGRTPLAPRTDTLDDDRVSWWVTPFTDRLVAESVDGIKPTPLT